MNLYSKKEVYLIKISESQYSIKFNVKDLLKSVFCNFRMTKNIINYLHFNLIIQSAPEFSAFAAVSTPVASIICYYPSLTSPSFTAIFSSAGIVFPKTTSALVKCPSNNLIKFLFAIIFDAPSSSTLS